jgi:transmembrane sensor
MSEFDADTDDVHWQAARWLARLHARDCSTGDRHGFWLWIARDPGNASAFEEMTAIWDAAGGLSEDGFARPARHDIRRRHVVMGGAGLLAAAGAGFGVMNVAAASVYRTSLGEQKRIALSDGTQMLLDTETQISVRLRQTVRYAMLDYGRVNFQVAADTRRPFQVEALERLVETNGSDLDVQCDKQTLGVFLIHGHASVRPPSGGAVALKDGERYTVGHAAGPVLDRPDILQTLAWQNGQAIFEKELLGRAADQMNRYSQTKLRITSPAIADLRISGVYRLGDVSGFAQTVSQFLPVQVHQEDARTITLSATRRNAL